MSEEETDFDRLRTLLANAPADVEVVPLDGGGTDDSEMLVQCPDCKQWIDVRDLGEILRHDGPGHTARPAQ